ncbi:hypothetical protein UFOVP274_32 [uncultured Caudovirales phage]|uniref:Uncharacterized protein n=1 Tax=uncultured Caudovirales phage TaxID=2100421 RepID=A0A6J5LNL7_9CAUD|nr:hypothetical protein UFOVP274_32 [uncultured Caudovirales phage]
MALKFRKGDNVAVNLKRVIPTGPVMDIKLDDDGQIQYLIEFMNENEEIHARWYYEDELVAAK